AIAPVGSHALEQRRDLGGADRGGADAVGRRARSLEEPAVAAARGRLDPSRTRLHSPLRNADRVGSGSGGSPGISDRRSAALSYVLPGRRGEAEKKDPSLGAL